MAERISRVKWGENLLMCYMDGLVSLSQHFPLDQAYNPLPEFGSSEMQGASSLQLLSSGKIFFFCFIVSLKLKMKMKWGMRGVGGGMKSFQRSNTKDSQGSSCEVF